eukprot:m.30970 g.30970  ORF g.30970 m.30970 type:complete len:438 (+) comp16374_c0_seq1:257-1570(+)
MMEGTVGVDSYQIPYAPPAADGLSSRSPRDSTPESLSSYPLPTIPVGAMNFPDNNRGADLGSFARDLSSVLMEKFSPFVKAQPTTKSSVFTEEVGCSGGIFVQQAGPGLITGKIDLVEWALKKQESLRSATGINILRSCILSLVNGTLGQRGLLMSKIEPHHVAVRFVDMVIDFACWLPSSSKRGADELYAGCITASMNKLSMHEVQQYFPLFLFGSDDHDRIAMVSLPMAAPAPVPQDMGDDPESPASKDMCEMMFCTTKQKKRKGVPYCGTCRKFMEETVKWYCDAYQCHPAKQKENFVQVVRDERYRCKNPKVGTCDCKSCHAARRFNELYPNCASKLEAFKRRTLMFDQQDPNEISEQISNKQKMEKPTPSWVKQPRKNSKVRSKKRQQQQQQQQLQLQLLQQQRRAHQRAQQHSPQHSPHHTPQSHPTQGPE